MTTRRSRAGAYADLVAGLLDVRADAATERFDAELAAAEDDGRIDPQTAKVLRWWQRESLRAMVEHARAVVPPTLLALEASAAGAPRDVESASQSWARADALDTEPEHETAPGRAPGAPEAPEAVLEWTDGAEGADVVDVTDAEVAPPTDLSEHRRRLLVAGLTRVRG